MKQFPLRMTAILHRSFCHLVCLSAFLLTSFQSSAALSGTYTINPSAAASASNYLNMRSAINDLVNGSRFDGGPSNGSGVTAAVVFELSATYTSSGETYPLTIGAITGTSMSNTVTFRPAAGVSSIISFTSTQNAAIIDFNGGDYVIMDGRPGGTGTSRLLQFFNVSTVGAVVRLINDASNNIIRHCIVQGQGTSATNGLVFFSSTTLTTGNDNNTIDSCDIRSGTNLAANCIYASGTFGKDNTGNTISNCNIYDFHSASNSSSGIYISNNNDAWTITGNHLYQTATRSPSTANLHYGIFISPSPGGNFTVSNNYIGGSGPFCSGSAWSLTSSISNRFNGIAFNTTAGTNNVTGNTIRNFSLGTTASTSAIPGVWCGIYMVSGPMTAANVTGNTIGSTTGNGSVTVTVSASGGMTYGIAMNASADTVNISNNTIGGMTAAATSSLTHGLTGIYSSGTAVTNISNNLVGSTTTANSMQATSTSTSSIGQAVCGINVHSGPPVANVVNNTIANLTNSYLGTGTTTNTGSVKGIVCATSGLTLSASASATVFTVTGNTVRNLGNVASYTGSTYNSMLLGIQVMTSTSAAATTVSGNTVHSLSAFASSAASSLIGVYVSSSFSGTGFNNQVSRNYVHSFSSASSGSAAMYGLYLDNGANFTLANNMVRLGVDAAGSNVTGPYTIVGMHLNNASGGGSYHNSVYIGGTGTGSGTTHAFQLGLTTGVRNVKNNIFVNSRSNSSGTGVHYAVRLGGTGVNPNGLDVNYNIYRANGTGGTLGYYGSAMSSLTAWQAASGQDMSSADGDPRFVNATGTSATVDLHLMDTTGAEASGTPIGAVTEDFDGNARSGLTATDIGADAGNFVASDIFVPMISTAGFTGNTSSTTNRTLSGVIITDSGTALPTSGGNVPRIWFRRSSPSASAWASTAATLSSGTGSNGTWSFTIDYSVLSITPALGDVYQYYIVVQDQALTPNFAYTHLNGASHTNVNTQVSAPTSPGSYTIVSGLPTSINVGTGQTYTSLSGFTGLFAAINAGALSGNTTVNITSNLNEDGFTALNSTGMNGYTLTIQPSAAATRIVANSVNTSNPMLRINGASGVIIDGRSGGSGQYLRIINTNTAPTACQPTIQVMGGSTSFTLRNCVVESNSSSTNTASIYLGTGNNTGITIRDNDIRDAAGIPGTAGVPNCLVGSFSNNVVSLLNNKLYNAYNPVNLSSAGNGCVISGNSIYYNASAATYTQHTAIQVGGGNAHLISGNYIGGQAANCGGSAWLNSSAVTFYGIEMRTGNGTASSIQNNTIQNINLTGTTAVKFTGILASTGNVDVSNNVVGHATTVNSIRNSGTSIGTLTMGIYNSSTGTFTASNNTVANITSLGTSSYPELRGICHEGTGSGFSAQGNSIFALTSAAATSGAQAPSPTGILSNNNSSGINISGNNIHDLLNNGPSSYAHCNGITITGASSAGTCNGNQIYGLTASSTAGPYLSGITINSGSAWTISNNIISITNSTNTNNPLVVGIYQFASAGTFTIAYNTVHLGGTVSSGSNQTYGYLRTSSATSSLRNNIFSITRSGGSATYTAIGNLNTTAPWSSNNNLCLVSNLSTAFDWSGVKTHSQWQTSSGGDGNSIVLSTSAVALSSFFTDAAASPPDMTILSGSRMYVRDFGAPVAGITTDFASSTRPGNFTSIGAYEYGSGAAPLAAVTSPTDLVCNGVCAGAVMLTATGGTPPYTYAWSPTSSTSNQLSSLCAGTYTCTITDGASTQLTKTVTINQPTALGNNTISSPQTTCSGSVPATLIGSTPTGATGSYTYVWIVSSTGAGTGFSQATGSPFNINYSPAALTGNRWYRRIVTSGSCPSDTSAAVAITVNAYVTGNTVTGNQTMCSGLTPSAIIGSTPGGGNGSTYTYSWVKSSSANSGYTLAAAPNNLQHYPPPALTQTTYYKRVVISGACAPDTSAYAYVTVLPNPTISFGTTRCVNSALTANIAPAGDSLVRWYKDGVLVQTNTTRFDTIGVTAYNGPTNGVYDPKDVKIDAAGNIYVVEQGYNRITRFAPGATTGTIVAQAGLYYPRRICFDGSGNMYVADMYNHRVVKFPPGSTSSTVGTVVAGGNGQGSGSTQLYYPTGVAVDAAGRIYVCDQSNNRIQRFPSNSTSSTAGTTVAGTGTSGVFDYHVSYPTDIVIDASDNLYILDAGNDRVMKYPNNSVGGSSGTFVAGGYGGGSFPQISGGEGLFVDASGYIFVADYSSHKILRFPPSYTGNGKANTIIGASGGGSAAYQLAFPHALFITSNAMYVADNSNGRVQRYTLSGNTYVPTTPGSYSVTAILSTGCYDTSVWVTADPQLSGNTTGSAQTICTGSAPAALTGATPTGGTGSYTYSWLQSTTGATTGYAPASGTNNTSGYAPGAISANTWFRRHVVSGGCNDSSAAIAITTNTPVTSNTVSGSQTICSGSSPTTIFGVAPLGGTGVYTYQWLASTTSATAGFSPAAGTNNLNYYISGPLTQTTWFRRRVTSGACSADTSAAYLVVVHVPVTNNTASSAQSICTGTTPAMLSGSLPTGGNGVGYSYSWLSSTTSATTGFAVASGTTTNQNYSPPALTASRWYKRRVISGSCPADTSAALMISVSPSITANTISGSQTVCSGSTPVAVTGNVPGGGNGSFSYTWLSSTSSSSSGFAAAPGTNNTQNYSPSAITATTWYKRVANSGGCADTSASIMAGVTPVITSNSVSTSQSVCSGSAPSSLTGTLPSGGNSSYTYTWQSSTTSATGGFTTASGAATGQNYTAPALTANTWYRRYVNSGGCADTSAAIAMTVQPVIASNTISSNQLICTGSTPAALSGSSPSGGNSSYTYSWLMSPTSATSGFSGATGTANAQNYSPPALIATVWFKRQVISGACRDTSAAVQITVNAPGTWTGALSSAWNQTANWSCPAVPTSAVNVTIPSGPTNMPLLTDAQQCNHLTIASGATLTMNAAASQLSVFGSISNSGTWTNTAGKVVMSGSAAQGLPGGTYNKLEIANAANVTLSGPVTLKDSLIFTSGKLILGTLYDLVLDNNSYATGGSVNRYIVTNGLGYVTSNNIGTGGKTGNVTIPVGNSTYNPVTLNNIATADAFTMRVLDSVTNSYTGPHPSGPKLTTMAVGRTWLVSSGTGTGNNATLTLQWNASDELTGFNFVRSSSYMAYYTGGTWIPYPVTGAAGSAPYTMTRAGITNFSARPFGVGAAGTLPVNLLSFQAHRSGRKANLNWETAGEKNNDHFTLSRSANGTDYEEIGSIPGNGNSSAVRRYEQADADAASFAERNGTNTVHYRLTQTDFDGTVSAPAFALVKMDKSPVTLAVQPNPFTHDLSVYISTPAATDAIVTITDMSGRVVAELSEALKAGSQSIRIGELSTLADGMYFVNIYAGGETSHVKVVKGR